MLFAYTYVPHAMEKMQEYIDYIFSKVWCKAPEEEYGLHLFKRSASLYQIMQELYRRDLAGQLGNGAGRWFYRSVNEIFNEFKLLSKGDIDIYRNYFDANNSIEELCSASTDKNPVLYEHLGSTNVSLNKKLEDFYSNIYSNGFFALKHVKETIGSDLNKYYDDFVRSNTNGICPFCGLMPLDNEFDPTRDAFDHYLPKSKYPFNSVNLKNLCPSCNKCNSGSKKDKNPLYDDDKNRRKAFYPFSESIPNIEISVSVRDKNWDQLAPESLSIDFDSSTHFEEVGTWNDLFRIERRYLARCCDNKGGLFWLSRVFDECHNYKLSVRDMLNAEIQSATNNKWYEANFLKKAFLEGCQRAGLFDPQ
jgi:hypothetical protein